MAKSTLLAPTDRFSEHRKDRALLAVVYSRIDSEAPAWGEISMDDQERTNCRWARQNGWDVVECIRDATSGSSTGLRYGR